MKRSDRETVRPGEQLIYTLVVRNTGQAVARDVVVTDTVPAALEVVDLHSTKGAIVVNGQTVTAYPAVLDPGEIVTITITTRVRANAQPGELVNRAVITTSSEGDSPGNNTSTVTTRIENPPAAPPSAPPSAPPASGRQGGPPVPARPAPSTPARPRTTTSTTQQVLPATGAPWLDDPLLIRLLPWGLLSAMVIAVGVGLIVRARGRHSPFVEAVAGSASSVPAATGAAQRRRLAPGAERPHVGAALPPGREADALPPPAALDRPAALAHLREE